MNEKLETPAKKTSQGEYLCLSFVTMGVFVMIILAMALSRPVNPELKLVFLLFLLPLVIANACFCYKALVAMARSRLKFLWFFAAVLLVFSPPLTLLVYLAAAVQYAALRLLRGDAAPANISPQPSRPTDPMQQNTKTQVKWMPTIAPTPPANTLCAFSMRSPANTLCANKNPSDDKFPAPAEKMNLSEIKPRVFFLAAAIFILFVAIFFGDGFRYWFFSLLRFVVFAAGAYAAYESDKKFERIALAAVALFYNPFFPVRLGDREPWLVANWITVAFFAFSVFLCLRGKKSGK